uniref:Uncharacterized protein n=1 Tax=Timema tahoe TaxID=61484 RepID=A0A7R9IEB6_9NEOP|nr:unnamed protein product [Timema tahoe]
MRISAVDYTHHHHVVWRVHSDFWECGGWDLNTSTGDNLKHNIMSQQIQQLGESLGCWSLSPSRFNRSNRSGSPLGVSPCRPLEPTDATARGVPGTRKVEFYRKRTRSCVEG